MNNYQKEYVARQIETIVSALRGINYHCEKSPNLCSDIAIGYPMEKSLDEMILDFITWKECINNQVTEE